jgi:hypothetical protein
MDPRWVLRWEETVALVFGGAFPPLTLSRTPAWHDSPPRGEGTHAASVFSVPILREEILAQAFGGTVPYTVKISVVIEFLDLSALGN